MILLKNISELLTLAPVIKKDGRKLSPTDAGIISNGALVFNQDKILWTGKTEEIPKEFEALPFYDLSGKCLTPGLVDCHTHLTFGGYRNEEYVMRLNGADYEKIGKAGGGILSSMRSTREISKADLLKVSRERVNRIFRYGVRTLEIKSGYGLDLETERKLLEVINELKSEFSGKVRIVSTFLMAHAVPPEFKSASEFINDCVLPSVVKLYRECGFDFVDIFHEDGYFGTDEATLLYKKANELGIPIKAHVDEFNDNKGAILASEFKATSCDHLLCTAEDGIVKLANSKTVAVLLPGTGFFLGKPQADGRKLLDLGAQVAIGSDYNPGSCHWDNILQIAAMSAPQYRMNLTEFWAAITFNAANALGLGSQGAIVEGFAPVFSLFNCSQLSEISYFWGRNFADTTDLSVKPS